MSIPQAFSVAIRRIFSDQEKLDEVGERAQQTLARDWSQAANECRTRYEALCNSMHK